MNYSILHLDPDENVILEVRKHWIVFAGFAISLLVMAILPCVLFLLLHIFLPKFLPTVALYISSAQNIPAIFLFIYYVWVGAMETKKSFPMPKLSNGLAWKRWVVHHPAYAIGYQNEAALNRQRQVVLTLRPWVNGDHDNFNQIMADFIIWLREKHDLETVFLPFQTDHTDDRERYEQVKKILGRNSAGFKLIIPEDYSQAVEMIGRSEAVIGMRLHSIIFAVLGRTPFLGISYSKKVRDFIETIGLDDFSLDYGKITLEQLKGKFDTLMAKKTEVSMKMEKAKQQEGRERG
jgi:hypothetical protein